MVTETPNKRVSVKLNIRRTIIIGRTCHILLSLSRIRTTTQCLLRPASHLPITRIYLTYRKNQLLLWSLSRNPELILKTLASPRMLASNPSGNQAPHSNAFSLLTTMTWTASVRSRRPRKRLTKFSSSPLVQIGKNSTIRRENNGHLQSRS